MNVRLPTPMMQMIDRLVSRFPHLYTNRQQFIESAIREKIEKLLFMEATEAVPISAE